MTEIVIPAGAFAKDFDGKTQESGGHAGTGVQHGTFKIPWDKGYVVVGVTTLLPAAWVGEDIDIFVGASTGGLLSEEFRVTGQLENTSINTTQTLGAEDWGTTEFQVIDDYGVQQRRFGIAIGRDPDHASDDNELYMNFEYLRIVCVTC